MDKSYINQMAKYLIPYFTIAIAASNLPNGILVADLSLDPNFDPIAETCSKPKINIEPI